MADTIGANTRKLDLTDIDVIVATAVEELVDEANKRMKDALAGMIRRLNIKPVARHDHHAALA